MKDEKITIYDIAEKTHFSVTTVHRALNNKGRISPQTKKLILDVAEALGYKANVAAQGLRRSPIKIGAILFCPVEEYVDSIIHGISASADELEKYNVSVDIRKIDYSGSKECMAESCRLINEFSDCGYNGIVLFLSTTLEETAELSSLVNRISEADNIRFATVANDITGINKVLHVGVNAFMAGSMAAEILELSCAGKDVSLLVASKTSPINMDYINGFMSYSEGGIFSKVSIYEHFDDKAKVIEVTKRMLSENPELCGVYMTTASSAQACKCITDMNKTDITVITTDLLSETPTLLKQKIANAAIFQDPFRQGKNVVRYLYNYITANTDGGVHLLSPQILLASNVKSGDK